MTASQLVCKLCGYRCAGGNTPTGAPTCPQCRVILVAEHPTSKNLLDRLRSAALTRGPLASVSVDKNDLLALVEWADKHGASTETDGRRLVAWMADDGRVVGAASKASCGNSSLDAYTIPLYAHRLPPLNDGHAVETSAAQDCPRCKGAGSWRLDAFGRPAMCMLCRGSGKVVPLSDGRYQPAENGTSAP